MIKIRTTAIGEGRPKICIPLVSDSTELLALECKDLAGTPFDLLEWRVDYLAASQNFQMEKNLKEGYEAIRSVFPDALSRPSEANRREAPAISQKPSTSTSFPSSRRSTWETPSTSNTARKSSTRTK